MIAVNQPHNLVKTSKYLPNFSKQFFLVAAKGRGRGRGGGGSGRNRGFGGGGATAGGGYGGGDCKFLEKK